MNKLTIGSIVTATLLLVGCGDSGSSSSPASDASNNDGANKKIGTGYYVDSAVEGVDYQCGQESGTTDKNGTFTFENGKNCNFTLGGLKLREINASSLEDNVTVLESNETVAQLLQTLDSDGNASNGIQIPKGAEKVIKETLTSLDDLNADLLSAVHDRLKEEYSNVYNGAMIDRNETLAHLDRTRADLAERHARTNSDVEQENRGRRENNSTPQNTREENANANNQEEENRGRGSRDTNSTHTNTMESDEVKNPNNSQEVEDRGRRDSNSTHTDTMNSDEVKNPNRGQEVEDRGRDTNSTHTNTMESDEIKNSNDVQEAEDRARGRRDTNSTRIGTMDSDEVKNPNDAQEQEERGRGRDRENSDSTLPAM